ncbi:MAG: C39 family peptidase [Anaerolineales bacterium]|nr:C39 family peptidase [Anaerolineales bacterium]
MNRFSTKTILIGLIIFLSMSALLWPIMRTFIAKQYLHRIPESARAFFATPLPSALPAPVAVETAVPPTIFVPTISHQQSAVSSQPPATTPPVTVSPGHPVTVPSNPSATPSPHHPITPSPTPLPAAARITEINVIPQKFNNCGPANVTILLDFYGIEADQLEIGDQIKPNYDDRNVSPWELVDYVNESAPLRATYYVGGDRKLLQRFLAAGFPVIIEKGLYPNSYDGWMGHYLTLVGYDDAEQAFISLDTFLGPWDSSGRFESYDFVDEFWHQFNNTFILIYPVEAETAVLALLDDTFQDPLLMWQHAAQTAQAQIRTNPDDAYAWFNLGAGLTRLGQLIGDDQLYANAATAFDRARTIGLPWRMLWYQFEPYEAYLGANRPDEVIALTDAILTTEGGQNVEETHLYRGLAFEMRGDSDMADAAFRRAISLNSNLTIDN